MAGIMSPTKTNTALLVYPRTLRKWGGGGKHQDTTGSSENHDGRGTNTMAAGNIDDPMAVRNAPRATQH